MIFGDIQSINIFVNIITLIFAYGVVVTISGCFKAWLAHYWGDDTAAEAGFLSLDPIVHTDIIGFLCYLWFRFGWAKYVPINSSNIRGKYHEVKQIVARFADTLAYVLFGVLLVMVFVAVSDYKLLELVIKRMLYVGAIPTHYEFTQLIPLTSSFKVTLIFVYLLLVYVCVIFGGISFVINLFHYIMEKIFEGTSLHEIGGSFFIIRLVALYVLMTLLINPVSRLVLTIIAYASKFCAYIFGVA